MDIQARLRSEVEARRDDLVALTQDLIRIPTRNPPGENYREICEYLDRRLTQSGFQTELIRAAGAIGDRAQQNQARTVSELRAARHSTIPGSVADADIDEAPMVIVSYERALEAWMFASY